MGKWLIYGATGYTGKLIAEESRKRGMTPIIAGRNHQKMFELGKKLDLETRIFDLEDADQCIENIQDCDLVLNCAGPFSSTCKKMLDACIKAKTHYLDITGELDIFEFVHGQTEKLKSAGIVAIPGVGFDVVPTDCLAALLKRELPDATELQLAFKATPSMLSPGTANTMIEQMSSGSAIRKSGKIVRVKPYSISRTITFESKPIMTAAIPWGDISTAWHSTGIPNIKVFVPVKPGQLKILKRLWLVTPLLKFKFVKNWVKKKAGKRATGPDLSQRTTGRANVWGLVKNKAGNSVEMKMRTPEPYKLTVDAAIKSVTKVLAGNIPFGAATPTMAFGADFYKELDGITVTTTRQ